MARVLFMHATSTKTVRRCCSSSNPTRTFPWCSAQVKGGETRHDDGTDTATATDNFLHDTVANGGESIRSMHVQCTKSTPPCRFFIRGVCRNGAACRFSHDSAVNILLKADCETSAAKSKPPSNSQLKREAVIKARREAMQRDSSGAGAREHAEALATPFTIVSHGWDQLTVDGIKAVVTYTNDEKTVDAWCDARRSGISADSVFMGLDTETKPSLFPGDIQRAPALLQLALRDGEECAVLLFAICHYEGAQRYPPSWPIGLVALLNDSRVCKSGVAVKGDVKQLRKHCPGLCFASPGDRKHFRDVAKAFTKVQREGLTNLQRDAGLRQGFGLKSLGALLFRDASRTVRLEPVVESDFSRTSLSDWERYPLDHSQQVYAALDAVLSQALAVTLATLCEAAQRSYRPLNATVAQRPEDLAFWKQLCTSKWPFSQFCQWLSKAKLRRPHPSIVEALKLAGQTGVRFYVLKDHLELLDRPVSNTVKSPCLMQYLQAFPGCFALDVNDKGECGTIRWIDGGDDIALPDPPAPPPPAQPQPSAPLLQPPAQPQATTHNS